VRPGHRAVTMAEKFQLPARATRGKRMRAAMAEEEDAADAEFDEDYQEEKEEEDVPDSDFDDPVSTLRASRGSESRSRAWCALWDVGLNRS
jgi:hypothetical protein